MSFRENGKIAASDSKTKNKLTEYDHFRSKEISIPAVENDQMLQMLRVLNQKVGTKQQVFVHLDHNGAVPFRLDMKVTDHVDLEVSGGKFSCVKIETNLNQTFYVSRGEGREIVRMELGSINADLVSSAAWNVNKSRKLKSEELGVTIESGYIYQIQMFASDFACMDGILEIQKKGIFEIISDKKKYNIKAMEFRSGFKVDGIDAYGMIFNEPKLSGTTYSYHVFAFNDELMLSLQLNFEKQDKDRAIARADKILKGFRWNDH